MMVDVTAVQVRSDSRVFQRAVAAATVLPWVAVLVCQQVPSLRWVVIGVGLATGAAHTVPTLGLYVDPGLAEHRAAHRVRYQLAPVGCFAAAVVLVLVGGPFLTAGIVGYAAWRVHHFARQNLGMFTYLNRARRVDGTAPWERRIICATGPVAMLGYAAQAAHFDDVTIPAAGVLRGLGAVGLAVLVVAVLAGSGRDLVRTGSLLAAVAFFGPLFVTEDPILAVAAYTAAHGAQYLLMTAHLAAGRQAPLGWLAGLGLACVGGGWVLNYGVNRFGPTLALALGAGFAMSHFVIDAGMWRPAEPSHRAWMRKRFAFL